MRIRVVGYVVVAAFALVSCLLAQQNCACGQTDCLTWTLNCTNCGLTYCPYNGQSKENPTVTDPLDNCKLQVTVSCTVIKANGSNQVCAQAGQVVQCYMRSITTAGYRCDNGNYELYAGKSCCHN